MLGCVTVITKIENSMLRKWFHVLGQYRFASMNEFQLLKDKIFVFHRHAPSSKCLSSPVPLIADISLLLNGCHYTICLSSQRDVCPYCPDERWHAHVQILRLRSLITFACFRLWCLYSKPKSCLKLVVMVLYSGNHWFYLKRFFCWLHRLNHKKSFTNNKFDIQW